VDFSLKIGSALDMLLSESILAGGLIFFLTNFLKNMKKRFLGFCSFFLLSVLSGCSVVGGIFKAGVWVGVLLVILVIGLIIYLVSRGSNRG
jgi:cytosine/uracil/thiamine/allantoin permease